MEFADQIGTLHTITQVAVALIGFTGIVVVFGERAKFQWTAEESLRLTALLTPSLNAFFCSFLPILLSMVLTSEGSVWRVSNGLLGISHGILLSGFLLNKEAKKTIGQQWNAGFGGVTICLHLLAAFGVLPWVAFIFIFGLIQQLWIGIFNFLLLFKPKSVPKA